ncbi:MAG: insulinase family protein [Ignavibacteriales bacterium]|nr:insulinase family protein [Ignavibacteriales bacterium]
MSEEIPHVRSVSVGIWLDTGSRDEHESNNGISHFIEHMVFKGTKHRTVREIAQSIESVGGYLNAFTSKEHTCYYARVLDEYTELAVDVLYDLIQYPTFPEKDLEKEKGVVIEELKNAEDDPDDIIHDYFDKSLFGTHPLGFPVIGTEANLRSFERKDLKSYLQQHYIPSNMVVAAAGNIQHKDLVEFVKKYLNKPSPRSKNGISKRAKPRLLTAEKSEFKKPIQQAHICIGTQSYSIKNKHRYPLLTLNTLLGDGMSSRLFQNIREKYGFAYSVYSYTNMMSDSGVFGVYIGTDKLHVDASIELIKKELRNVQAKPISKVELNRTKAQLKGSMMLSLESIPSRMMRLGSSELYFNELNPIDSIIKQIDAVTQDDVQAVANELFVEDKLSTIIFQPDTPKDQTSIGPISVAARKA